jgi:hypothetical protein
MYRLWEYSPVWPAQLRVMTILIFNIVTISLFAKFFGDYPLNLLSATLLLLVLVASGILIWQFAKYE